MSEEALQIAEKKEFIHLNVEFQRIARRDKKALLNKQSKEIEVNSRMGKNRGLFKKIRGTKGTKDSHNKRQKCYGLNRS